MSNKSIKEIEYILRNLDQVDDSLLSELMQDERKGVRQLVSRWKKEIEIKEKAKKKFFEMTSFERKYFELGHQWIAGVDEVGRGPLAGPVIAAAVILPADFTLIGIDDSKQLSEKKREEFYKIITEKAIDFGIGVVAAEMIDAMNIYEATKKAMNDAIHSLKVQPEVLLIDAMKLDIPCISESIIKGDMKSISIAAASIIAKVTRDKMMQDFANEYPQYRFEKNMGYGTKDHLDALNQYGITPIHRKSFAPIKQML